MGGYAVYVWPAYSIVAIVLIANIVIARRRHQRALAALQRRVDLGDEGLA
jgi:heme exporter protein CcmD